MEFHEKLQHLRRRSGLTQEQLAERLFVSRTAVSKWESGRGYPNLESLKDISALFAVSIDELLSNGELIELAETEHRANLNKISGLVFGVVDAVAAALLFMPLCGQQEREYVRAVTLLACGAISGPIRLFCIALLAVISAFGLLEIAAGLTGQGRGAHLRKLFSAALSAGGILLFALLRQPYITAFLFLLFLVKVALMFGEADSNYQRKGRSPSGKRSDTT